MKASAAKRQKTAKAAKAPSAAKSTVYNAPKKNGRALFAKGNPGKPRGRLTSMKFRVKEAVLEAAERSGRDGRGKDGMVGYLVWLSRNEPGIFGRLLMKVMPTEVELADRRSTLTPSEAADRLRQRNIPVPPLLLELTAKTVSTPERDAEARRRSMRLVDDIVSNDDLGAGVEDAVVIHDHDGALDDEDDEDDNEEEPGDDD